jgi:hypothetical protein
MPHVIHMAVVVFGTLLFIQSVLEVVSNSGLPIHSSTLSYDLLVVLASLGLL